MNKIKIFKIVIAGSFMLNLPFLFGLYCIFTRTDMKDLLFYTLILSSLMLYYWSYFIPYYKYYSIRKLRNKDEWNFWYKASTFAFIICAKKSFFEPFECWNKGEYKKYKYLLKQLDKNEIL